MLLVLHPFSQNLPHEKWSKPRKPHPKLPRKGHYRMCLGASEGFFQGVTKNAFFQKWETVVQFHFLTAKSRKTFFCLKRKQQFIKFQGEQGRRQQEGRWCPVPHFMFAPPVAAYNQYCILKMSPPCYFCLPAAKSWERAWGRAFPPLPTAMGAQARTTSRHMYEPKVAYLIWWTLRPLSDDRIWSMLTPSGASHDSTSCHTWPVKRLLVSGHGTRTRHALLLRFEATEESNCVCILCRNQNDIWENVQCVKRMCNVLKECEMC